jgi:cyclopropane fatty-acyl-phospholipid synthase-like methyltransferase
VSPGDYCIRPDYQSNPLEVSPERTGKYWTEARIARSRHYQFGVYRYAAELIQAQGYSSVLDVGCGVGAKLETLHRRLPGLKIIGGTIRRRFGRNS